MSKHQDRLNIQAAATFAYLQQIQIFSQQHPELFAHDTMALPPYDKLNAVMNEIQVLDRQTPSKKLYRRFHEALEEVALYEMRVDKKDLPQALAMDKLFIQAYENESEINALVYEKVIQSAHHQGELAENIRKKTTHPNKNTHIEHPDNQGNAFFTSMLGIGYHPLKRNNVPYVAFGSATQKKGPHCIRMGAQTQKNGMVNPSFKRYLLANTRKAPSIQNENQSDATRQYDYVYINLLKRSARSQEDIEKLKAKKTFFARQKAKLTDKFVRYSEGKRGKALELLNFHKDLNTAVITLPADNLFLLGKIKMKKGGASENSHLASYGDIFDALKHSILYNKNDFYFSNDVRTRLFGSQVDNGQLETLFSQAVQDVIGPPNAASGQYAPFTPEQRNAILFQFIKSNLSNHILDVLAPQAYNFSCKDGIDRGAIHTLWYHLNEQYKNGRPMTEAEFKKHLNSPALIVKYRGLNHNLNLIWNVLNHRMKAEPDFAKSHPWAIDWLKNNLPPAAKQNMKHPPVLTTLNHQQKHHKPLPTPPQLSTTHQTKHSPSKR